MGWGCWEGLSVLFVLSHVQEAHGPSPALKNFPSPPTPCQPTSVSFSQQKSTGNQPPRQNHQPTCHLPQVVPPSFSPYTYQPTDTPPNLANWLKRGSIRKKLRRGQSLMAPFSTLRSHTLRPLYSLLVFPSLFPRIARMICSEQRQVYRLADTSALWNFN